MINSITFFHGAAIIRVIHHESFRSIKVYDENNCSYLINEVAGMYIKYSQKRLAPWHFTFSGDHIHEITEMDGRLEQAYVVLVCNEDGICCLNWHEFTTVISIENKSSPKWIAVSRMKGEKYFVRGSDGELKHKIGNSDFPKKIYHS